MIGAIYEEIDIEKPFGLGYIIWFKLRRILFAMVAVFLADQPGTIHLIYLVSQQVLHIIYIISVKPFEDPLLNKMEAFNELIILGIVYHFFLFFDFVDDADVQY